MMTEREYTQEVLRTCAEPDHLQRLILGAMGLAGESGEVVDVSASAMSCRAMQGFKHLLRRCKTPTHRRPTTGQTWIKTRTPHQKSSPRCLQANG
jgi:hypothetical protein